MRSAVEACPTPAPEESLGNNQTAHEIWKSMEALILPGPRQEAFRRRVPVVPLVRLYPGILPEDVYHSGYTVLAIHNGKLPGGAYKLRGITNALLDIPEQDRGKHNVVVASTGNHAIEGAIASRELGFKSFTAYCPEGASEAKLPIIRQLGGKIKFKPRLDDALAAAEDDGKRRNTIFVHPYNQRNVIAGQGSKVFFDFAEQFQQRGIDVPNEEITFISPGGGGGNAAGAAVAANVLFPGSKSRVSQAEGAPGIAKARAGETFDKAAFNDACDGAAVPIPGELPMRILSDADLVASVDVVTNAQIGEAMAVLSQRIEVPEPAGALAMADALKIMRENPKGKGLLVVDVSGINKTPAKVAEFMQAAEKDGYISPEQAQHIVQQAYLERTIYGIDEVSLRRERDRGPGHPVLGSTVMRGSKVAPPDKIREIYDKQLWGQGVELYSH